MMIARLRMQSASDIITNSSSEVFIIRNQKSRNQEIFELITNVARAAGLKINDMLHYKVASSNGEIDDGYKYKKGDMLIWSKEDNSIPYWFMEFIEQLDCNNITRYHLG